MKSKQVFAFNSYKTAMAYFLSGEGRRGQLTRAAEVLNCQRSYLSRVISDNLHLTPDHAFNLTRFWKFSADERNYFQLLVEYERAADPNYRAHLKSQLTELKRQHESIQERTGRKSLSIDALHANYFSTWIWSAIHFLTSIPAYQSIDGIADRLGIKKETIAFYLKELASQGFVENKGEAWVYRSGEFHVPKDSPLVILHHQNWRSRALVDAQEFGNSHVHFTGVLTLSHSDVEKLKELVLGFISEANSIAGPSKPEEAVALTCDLFRV